MVQSPAGIPNQSDYVIIPVSSNNPIISGTDYKTFACKLLIRNNASLNILSSNTITVTNDVTVEASGNFQIENNASLIQIDNVSNSGNIEYKRTASVRKLDYVYWSSPVAGMNVIGWLPLLKLWLMQRDILPGLLLALVQLHRNL
jgi:hypothetical protein